VIKKVHEVEVGEMIVLDNILVHVEDIHKKVLKDTDSLYRIYYEVDYSFLNDADCPMKHASILSHTDIDCP